MRDLFPSLCIDCKQGAKRQLGARAPCPPLSGRPEFGIAAVVAAAADGDDEDDRIIHHGRGGAKYALWTGEKRKGEREGENRQFSTILRNETAAVESFVRCGLTPDSGEGDNLTGGGKTNPLIWDGRGRRMEDQSITATKTKTNPYLTGVIQQGCISLDVL